MRRIATLTTLVLTPLLLAGCSQQEADVVDRALTEPVRSAQVALTVDLAPAGGPGMTFSMAGPFQAAAPGQIERFDWTLRADAAGQRLEARVVSSGRDVFVAYGGETYAVGEQRVAALVREQAAAERRGGDAVEDLDDVRRLGVDLERWFPQSDTEEESEVAGQPTTRVTGRMDISVVVRDLRRLLRRPELRAQVQGRVPDEAFDELRQAISDPRFRLEAGREDGKLRALSGSLRIRQGGAPMTLRFGLTLRDVDRPVRIQAPASGRPIAELLRQLGLAGAERELETTAG